MAKNRKVQAFVDPALKRWLQARAKSENRSLSQYIAIALDEHSNEAAARRPRSRVEPPSSTEADARRATEPTAPAPSTTHTEGV